MQRRHHGLARRPAGVARRLKLKGDIATDLYNIQQQLVQLQELTGQSQQRLSELHTQLEARGEQIQGARRPAPGDSARHERSRHRPPPIRCTRPRSQQLRRGSTGTARIGLRETAPDLSHQPACPTRSTSSARAIRPRIPTRRRCTIGQVVDRLSDRRPGRQSALYKLGLLAERRKDTAKAKDAYQRVVQKYPQSDEAALARDRLKALGR